MMNSLNALTGGSAACYGSQLCKPALVNKDRNNLESISGRRLSRPLNSDMGQLRAEVVKS